MITLTMCQNSMCNSCSVTSGDDLMRCVDLYNQSQSKWFEEMVTSSLVRLDIMRKLKCFLTLDACEPDVGDSKQH